MVSMPILLFLYKPLTRQNTLELGSLFIARNTSHSRNVFSWERVGVCLVSVFKHSFLCLNTENGGPGLKFFCLVSVFTFCIQIQLLYN
jgi:hypothetical protein